MNKMDFNGSYKLKAFNHNEDISYVFQNNFIPEGWLDTAVPQDVRTVLRREGLISGHFYGKDVDSERWIDEKDWVYYRRFFANKDLENKRNILEFEGIDTLALIYLNGEELGFCENMFITYKFDISDKLIYGKTNTLVIKILSPIESLKGIDRTGLYPKDDTDRLLIRKSQMNYGWDFCGHCLTTGLWKGITLYSIDDNLIDNVFIHTDSLEDDKALIGVEIDLEQYQGKTLNNNKVLLTLSFNGTVVVTQDYEAEKKIRSQFVVDSPKLWWPRPYGDPNLYTLSVRLMRDATMIDEFVTKYGIRTVKLVQEPLPEGGRSFIFEINHRRLFIRGANWVPMNAVYAEIKDEQYDYFIERAIDSNLSMLRIWGGGIYESKYFYDLCDKCGIMVFQDFMLACGVLRQDDKYVELVSQEVDIIAKQYRNHTSLVIWAADNELDEAYRWYDILDQFKSNKVNRVGVKNAIEIADPTRPFLVSSPCSPFEDEEGADDTNSHLQGDMHVYLTRFKSDSEYYYKKLLNFVPRFMSEFGFSSLPSKDTFDKINFFNMDLDLALNPWLGELEELNAPSIAKVSEEVIYFSQYSHAQGLKYWLEYMRCYKWTCGGALYWKFNDPIAPSRPDMLFSTLMSVIDSYGKTKLPYYYARRAYDDVILAFKEDKDGGVTLYSCNETQISYTGQLQVDLLNFSGEVLDTYSIDCIISADSSIALSPLPMDKYNAYDKHQCYVKATFISEEINLINRYMMLEIGEWFYAKLPETKLSIDKVEIYENQIQMAIRSTTYAQDVILDILDVNAIYSDNCFCMDASEIKNISIKVSKGNCLSNKILKIKPKNGEAIAIDLN